MDIEIFDTTLRDGEQQACINFSQTQKIEIARLLRRVGVTNIELMPCSNGAERDVAETLIQDSFSICAATPLNKESIDLSLNLLAHISLFQAVSDDLLKIRYKTNDVSHARQINLTSFCKCLEYIKSYSNTKIYVAGEDTVSSDRGYLKELVNSISKYIDAFFVCDSKGVSTPREMEELIGFLKEHTNIRLGIHAHNDYGYAEENTVVAVKNGATIISGTVNGIGERAGNCDYIKVLRLLGEDGIYARNVDYSLLDELEVMVGKFSILSRNAPCSPESFWCESGIHVNALLYDLKTGYNGIDPSLYGLEHQVFFGKKSGISNFKYYFGNRFSNDILKAFLEVVKQASIAQNKSFNFEETVELLRHTNRDYISLLDDLSSSTINCATP